MSTSDVRILVDAYTGMAANLGIMLTQLDAEITSINAEVSTLQDDVMGGAQTDLDTQLEAKRVANGWQSIKTAYTGTSIASWNIWGYDGNPISGPGDMTRESDHSFKFTGGASVPGFTVNTKVKCQPGNIERTIISQSVVAYQPGPDPPAQNASVTVNLDPDETALPIGLSTVERCEVVYAYNGTGWDSDAVITNDVQAFALAYSHINDPIDLNGTYGLIARISSITTGRDVQVLNKAKYDSFVALYEQYAA